jgi:hypothetical protein
MVRCLDDLTITTAKEGAREYSKVSYPIRYGIYDEIKTRDHIFQFNLLGEIRHIQGRRGEWPNSGEWLKRSEGNDWAYYSSGNYSGIFERFGEYYFPCLSYPSNSIMGEKPFRERGVQRAFHALEELQKQVTRIKARGVPAEIGAFLERLAGWGGDALALRAEQFHRIIGGPVSVLPPDARHADYDVIPLFLVDGCLYRCGFCSVKSGRELTLRTRESLIEQLAGLKRFYGPELQNYNALFLGQHDTLCAGPEVIEFAAQAAYGALGFKDSFMRRPTLFLFGSVDSLLDARERLFQLLDTMPFFTYVNVGLESSDGVTLDLLKKPVSPAKVRDAFARMLDINRRYERIEVSANFVIGLGLPEGHLASILQLSAECRGLFSGKGTLYISPLAEDRMMRREEARAFLAQFDRAKAGSILPTYLYLIQRL